MSPGEFLNSDPSTAKRSLCARLRSRREGREDNQPDSRYEILEKFEKIIAINPLQYDGI